MHIGDDGEEARWRGAERIKMEEGDLVQFLLRQTYSSHWHPPSVNK